MFIAPQQNNEPKPRRSDMSNIALLRSLDNLRESRGYKHCALSERKHANLAGLYVLLLQSSPLQNLLAPASPLDGQS
jgi:hypothetical protein